MSSESWKYFWDRIEKELAQEIAWEDFYELLGKISELIADKRDRDVRVVKLVLDVETELWNRGFLKASRFDYEELEKVSRLTGTAAREYVNDRFPNLKGLAPGNLDQDVLPYG